MSRFAAAMIDAPALRMSAANWVEAAIVVDSHKDPAAKVRFDDLVGALRLRDRSLSPSRMPTGSAPPTAITGAAITGTVELRRLFRLCPGQASRRASAVQGQRFLADRHRAGAEGLTMPELFLELFSEEIPARMQARAADDLARLVTEALAPLAPASIRTFYGPRRIALAAEVPRRWPPAARPSAAHAPARRSRRSPASCASTARAASSCARRATTGCWRRSRPRSRPRR